MSSKWPAEYVKWIRTVEFTGCRVRLWQNGVDGVLGDGDPLRKCSRSARFLKGCAKVNVVPGLRSSVARKTHPP